MREIDFSAEQLVESLLILSTSETVCLLDSCGAEHLGSRFLAAGVNPSAEREFSGSPDDVLTFFDEVLNGNFAAFFTFSYEFGLKINNLAARPKELSAPAEPDLFIAAFDAVIVHDYQTGATKIFGGKSAASIEAKLSGSRRTAEPSASDSAAALRVESNYSRAEYIAKIAEIQELIRRGETYQTNFTRRVRAELPPELTAQTVFRRLRKNHPAPFAAFIKRQTDYVVSASPERFFVVSGGENASPRIISASPIKGTRPRGANFAEDEEFKNELLASAKDLAENVMIVDLLRNDIGRVCRFGSVRVAKLCDLEIHPTLFHLVSTVEGELRNDAAISDVIRAVFPCGSITGAPKISTMKIIDRLENTPRGLSMGAVGFSIDGAQYPSEIAEDSIFRGARRTDLSVAIRTMTIRDNCASFNVGGGIVIDSTGADEYEETSVKAKALLDALDHA